MGQQSVETSAGRSGRLPDADGVWRLAIGMAIMDVMNDGAPHPSHP